jgi:hypothetical protein
MENNKRRFLERFCCLTLGAVFMLAAWGYIREIRSGRESIARRREALNSAPPLPPGYLSLLEARLAELRAQETPEGTDRPQPEDPVGTIRNTLRTHAIGVERLRTLSTGGAAVTEFTLSSASANFLKFLQGAADLPLPLNYINIKPNAHAPTLDVTVRFGHAQ